MSCKYHQDLFYNFAFRLFNPVSLTPSLFRGAIFKGGFEEQDNYQYEYEVRVGSIENANIQFKPKLRRNIKTIYSQPREPEVQAMMNFILDNPFVLSIRSLYYSFHFSTILMYQVLD